jgi:hypothetical protein
MNVSATSPVGKVVDWFKGDGNENGGPSFDRAGKGALIGTGIGGAAVIGMGSFKMYKPEVSIRPLNAALRIGVVASVGLAELGLLSTVRLPDDPKLSVLGGMGLGAAALGGGGSVIAAAVAPRLLEHPANIGYVGLGLAAAGAGVGALLGLANAGKQAGI